MMDHSAVLVAVSNQNRNNDGSGIGYAHMYPSFFPCQSNGTSSSRLPTNASMLASNRPMEQPQAILPEHILSTVDVVEDKNFVSPYGFLGPTCVLGMPQTESSTDGPSHNPPDVQQHSSVEIGADIPDVQCCGKNRNARCSFATMVTKGVEKDRRNNKLRSRNVQMAGLFNKDDFIGIEVPQKEQQLASTISEKCMVSPNVLFY